MPWLTPKQVHYALAENDVHYTQRTVERWARTGQVKAKRIGERGHYLIECDAQGWPVAANDDEEQRKAA